mgnify:CR=1 FL=1
MPFGELQNQRNEQLLVVDATMVEEVVLAESLAMTQLEPEGLNGTNELRLYVCANEADGHALLIGLIDNLGKGASGQAVQNMNLMLRLPEAAGLE